MDRTVYQTVSWTVDRIVSESDGECERHAVIWNDIVTFTFVAIMTALPDYIVRRIVFYVVLYCSFQCYLPLSLRWMALSESTGRLIIAGCIRFHAGPARIPWIVGILKLFESIGWILFGSI